MSKGRIEAFSDGVLAIVLTIMVLELRAPHGADLAVLGPVVPKFLGYVLSFVFVGIYWNNHHHLFQIVKHVDGRVLWANLHLLFWLSLVPFTTAWMGENHFAAVPVAVYGVVLLCAGIAYYLLTLALLALHEKDSHLARAIGSDFKGKISLLCYVIAVAVAFWLPLVACAIYVLVALLWLFPDRRIEKLVSSSSGPKHG